MEKFVGVAPTLQHPFDQEADPVHITASAILVNDAGDRTALHLHKRLGIWLQPGGHIEAGESPADAALRETIEEIGVPARHAREGGLFVHVDVHAGPRGHTHLDLRYLLRSPDMSPNPADGESRSVGWFPWQEAESMADDALRGALRAVRDIVAHQSP